MPLASSLEEISPQELLNLCAVDSELFCRKFFPRAFRQASPGFSKRFWEPLDDPEIRLVNLLMFRGSAKTTRLRAYTAKRIAYGISRTILYIGRSEHKAAASINWIKRQVLYNEPYKTLFQLTRGSKWADTEAEIIHGIEQTPINIVGYGITGPIRGINFDDYRPDLIVVDDSLDDENSSTPDQRDKVESLIYGALMNGLAPRSEAPEAKLVNLQTPLNRADFAWKARTDPSWHTVEMGCWTPETSDLPLEKQESAWPARWSSQDLREKKRQYIRRNQLSIWLREMEVRITSPELNLFRPEWLQEWDLLPESLTHILAIDPVPPPSDVAVQKGMQGRDWEAMAIVGVRAGKYYVREISVNRGHEPSWTIAEFFRLAIKYKVSRVLVEANGYQRTLKWILEQAMREQRKYFRIEDFTSQQSKYLRIQDGLSGPFSNRVVFLPPLSSPEGRSDGMQMFRQQFCEYSNVNHDDALESVAVGIAGLQGMLGLVDEAANDDLEDDEDYEPIAYGKEALCP